MIADKVTTKPYNFRVSPADLEQLLRDLPSHGTLEKDRPYRQIWRFEFEGQGYYLKFYPRGSRIVPNRATREFERLQALQKAGVLAPRAVAKLMGLSIKDKMGDAVILQAIEPSITLDKYASDFQLRGEPVPNHLEFARQIVEIVRKLGKAKLGHNDLHLGNLLLKDGQLYLLDAYAVRAGGVTMEDMFQLAHSVQGFSTHADLQRGWNELGPGGPVPTYNPTSRRQWKKFLLRTRAENDYFGLLKFGSWSGVCFKNYKYPRRWAPASALKISSDDWRSAWPLLWKQIESGQLTVLKESPSGDVLAGEVVLGGKPIQIIVKRPYKRYWYRYLNEIGRGSRAWRAWKKAWNLVIRDIPTAWPLLMMQKRTLGYITDAVFVQERVPGATLAAADLDGMTTDSRDMLLRRTGRILRQIESFGMSHFDAKASNWIVQEDPKLGPRPVLIDVDGVRNRRWVALGIDRLLRSMREHPQYTVADSLSLCQGYAPYSRMLVQEKEEE